MVRKILAAIDRSPNSRVVFDQAIALAKATGANLMLLHVLSSEEHDSPRMQTLNTFEYTSLQAELLDDYRKQWETYEEEGLKLLQSLTKEATRSGVRTEFSQNFGSPGRKICEIAESWAADLIVISRRGHSGLNELLLGSVSNYVFHHTPCSMYVVHAVSTPRDSEGTAATFSVTH